jgi:hypothetical protein
MEGKFNKQGNLIITRGGREIVQDCPDVKNGLTSGSKKRPCGDWYPKLEEPQSIAEGVRLTGKCGVSWDFDVFIDER